MLFGSIGAYYLAKELLREEHGIHKSESGHYYYISPHPSGKGDDMTHYLEVDADVNLHEVPHDHDQDHDHMHSHNHHGHGSRVRFGNHDHADSHNELHHAHSYHSGAYPFSLTAYMDRHLPPAQVEMTLIEPQAPGALDHTANASVDDLDRDKTPPRMHSTRPHTFVSPARRWSAHITQYNPFGKSYAEIPDTIMEHSSATKKKGHGSDR